MVKTTTITKASLFAAIVATCIVLLRSVRTLRGTVEAWMDGTEGGVGVVGGASNGSFRMPGVLDLIGGGMGAGTAVWSDSVSDEGSSSGSSGEGNSNSGGTTATARDRPDFNHHPSHHPIHNYTHRLCFVTCQYFTGDTNQSDTLLNVPEEVPDLHSSPLVRFLAYTNQPKRLVAPGWDVVEAPPSSAAGADGKKYRRQITASRWPKFQGYRDPRVDDGCDVVFYMDGAIRFRTEFDDDENDDGGDDDDDNRDVSPSPSLLQTFQEEAHRILTTPPYLGQTLHKVQYGPGMELRRIVFKKKDTLEHAEKSYQWLLRDYANDTRGKGKLALVDPLISIPMYENPFFGYAVHVTPEMKTAVYAISDETNLTTTTRSFQDVADFFWDHYSRESDSWRDQPLWSYALYKLGVTPLQLFPSYQERNRQFMYVAEDHIQGGRHTYVGEDVVEPANATATETPTVPTPGTLYHKFKYSKLPSELQQTVKEVLGFTTPNKWNYFVKTNRITHSSSPLVTYVGAAGGRPRSKWSKSALKLKRWGQLSKEKKDALRLLGYVGLTWDYPTVRFNPKPPSPAAAAEPSLSPPQSPGFAPTKTKTTSTYKKPKKKVHGPQRRRSRPSRPKEGGADDKNGGSSSLKDRLKSHVQASIQEAIQRTLSTSVNGTTKTKAISKSRVKRMSVAEQAFLRKAAGGPHVVKEYRKTVQAATYNRTTNATAANSTDGDFNSNIRICFVASQFFADSNDQTDKLLDLPLEVPNLWGAPNISFFMFTNLANLTAPGWTLVVRDYSRDYQRIITQSRWPKFQAYKDPLVRERCDVVAYLDGAYTFTIDSVAAIRWTAERVLLDRPPTAAGTEDPAPPRFAQKLHDTQKGPGMELRRILQHEKDTPERADETLRWMKHGLDGYNDRATMYDNSHFWYALDDPTFHNVSNFFWDLYSKEEHSWRDQPLWAYCMHRLGVQPRRLIIEEEDYFYDVLLNRTGGQTTVDDLILDFIVKDSHRIEGGRHVYIEKTKLPPYHKSWKSISKNPAIMQARAATLGYDEETWNTFGEIDPPILAGRKWNNLTEAEKHTLSSFGHRELTWDYKMQPRWKILKKLRKDRKDKAKNYKRTFLPLGPKKKAPPAGAAKKDPLKKPLTYGGGTYSGEPPPPPPAPAPGLQSVLTALGRGNKYGTNDLSSA